MKKIRSILYCAVILFLTPNFTIAKEIIPASKGVYASSFAIIVDTKTLSQVRDELIAYKNCLNEEGLGAFIIADDWATPEQVKSEIVANYKKRPILEGIVFVGDIPVVRVHNAQHMTSAFKMDEVKFPKEESAVPTDRFYDDLDLKFNFVERDNTNPLHFYYRLSEDSPQNLQSDIYSARMTPPSDYGVDRSELLKRYLKKVVIAHKEQNAFDKLIVFNGHGYNSDCLTAWNNEQFVMKEHFPLAFKSSEGNGFYNFRQDPFMKFKLYDKIQEPKTDLFIFHEHGAFDTQYITGEYPSASSTDDVSYFEAINDPTKKIGHLAYLSSTIRNQYRKYKGEKAENFKKTAIEKYKLTQDFFDQKRLDSTKLSDSKIVNEVNIYLDDLKDKNMQSRVTIFDACYNGSFHRPGYIAGYHVFGNGNTVVAQGNTVNVLQDKWTIELIGILNEGARVGFWQKETQFLESHLIGDPTFKFTSANSKKLNYDLALSANSKSIWEGYLKSNNPNLKAIALKMIGKIDGSTSSASMLNIYKTSEFYGVRMEALKRLIDIKDANMVAALNLAINDPYELIRRNAARYAGYSGDESLVKSLVSTVLFSDESQRVQYAAASSLKMFPSEVVICELKKQGADTTLINNFISDYNDQQSSLEAMNDKKGKVDGRLSIIRSYRNYNVHAHAQHLLAIVTDQSDNIELRIAAAEALGWFDRSIKRTEIVTKLKQLQSNPSQDKRLLSEIQQTITRLLNK